MFKFITDLRKHRAEFIEKDSQINLILENMEYSKDK